MDQVFVIITEIPASSFSTVTGLSHSRRLRLDYFIEYLLMFLLDHPFEVIDGG